MKKIPEEIHILHTEVLKKLEGFDLESSSFEYAKIKVLSLLDEEALVSLLKKIDNISKENQGNFFAIFYGIYSEVFEIIEEKNKKEKAKKLQKKETTTLDEINKNIKQILDEMSKIFMDNDGNSVFIGNYGEGVFTVKNMFKSPDSVFKKYDLDRKKYESIFEK